MPYIKDNGGVIKILKAVSHNVMLCLNCSIDTHWQSYHLGSRALRLYKVRGAKDTRQGRHPSRPAAFDLCRQAARGRSHATRLPHSDGVHSTSGAAIA